LAQKGPLFEVAQHTYSTRIHWSAEEGSGTTGYAAYRRDHTIGVEGKATILASSDPSFRGDATRYNPEELLVASLSSCHMLWYLHLCATSGVTVVEYTDDALGTMKQEGDGSGQFVRVELRPRVVVDGASSRERAFALHERAHTMCFIARSVNFPVEIKAGVTARSAAD